MIILIFTMLSLLLGGVLLGLAIYPSVILLAPLAHHGPLGLSMALGMGYFVSGGALLFWCALFHHLMLMHLKPGRHKLTSLQAFRWASASSLYMLVKFTVGDFFMITPLGTLYLKILGAKIGKNVMINSKYLHDHGLLEIGDGCLIGGDAVMSAHVAEGGHLVLSPIKLGQNVLISQKAVLMPGVEVGDNSIVAAGAIVLKDTKIPANEIWGGVPAKFLKARQPKEPK